MQIWVFGSDFAVAGGLLLALGVDLLSDTGPDFPERLEKDVLLPLTQQVRGHAAGPDRAAADDALGEFQMVEAEELEALVVIEHGLGDLMQRNGLRVGKAAAIDVINGDVGLFQGGEKRFAESRRQ